MVDLGLTGIQETERMKKRQRTVDVEHRLDIEGDQNLVTLRACEDGPERWNKDPSSWLGSQTAFSSRISSPDRLCMA